MSNNINREMPPTRKRYLEQQEHSQVVKPNATGVNMVRPPVQQKPIAKKPLSPKERKELEKKQKQQAKLAQKSKQKAGRKKPVKQSEILAKPEDIQRKALKQKSKIAKREAKQNKNKNKGRRGKRNLLVYYILFFVVSVTVIIVLSTTVLFNIESVSINGENPYTEQEIIDNSGIIMGENLIRLDTGTIESNLLKNLPYIDKAVVSKKLPSGVQIDVTQTVTSANVQRGSFYYLISENGRILEVDMKSPKADYITIIGYNPEPSKIGDFIEVANDSKRNLVFRLLENVRVNSGFEQTEYDESGTKTQLMFSLIKIAQESGLDKIQQIDITDIYNITLKYDSRIEIKIGTATDAAAKLKIAQTLISEGKIGEDEKGTLTVNNIEKATFLPIYDVVAPETTVETTTDTSAESVESVESEPAEETTDETTSNETSDTSETETEMPSNDVETTADENNSEAENTDNTAE